MKLEATELTWSAGNRIIVDGISVPAGPAASRASLGPNEPGKSAPLGILTHSIWPPPGSVALDSQPTTSGRPPRSRPRCQSCNRKPACDKRRCCDPIAMEHSWHPPQFREIWESVRLMLDLSMGST